ncbi:MAG TPA: hypothetical protein VNG13_10485 [Mycobacteriales bacterium]|nr:hypothetical protein [Mycobacteriales bacterium]
MTGLVWADVHLGVGTHVRCHGKGRRERTTPLTRPVAAALADWRRERDPAPTEPVFPTRAGTRMSTDAVADLLAKHVAVAWQRASAGDWTSYAAEYSRRNGPNNAPDPRPR